MIRRILDGARHSPSGVNMQPWEVAVVTGETRKRLQEKIGEAYRQGQSETMDYQYYPKNWVEPFKSRRMGCGRQMYDALGIARHEKERRQEQWAANYRAFDAPVVIYCFMPPVLETGSFMDYGMFIQSLLLMAALGTCAQGALAEYPSIVKEFLGYPEEYRLLCGIALGYEDKDAAVNHYRTPRKGVEEFVRFFD